MVIPGTSVGSFVRVRQFASHGGLSLPSPVPGLWSKLTQSLYHSATKQDIEDHFNSQGTGKITEIKLMNGFGFIEYEDALDARDIVPSESTGRPEYILY